jgi:hypothetical protein
MTSSSVGITLTRTRPAFGEIYRRIPGVAPMIQFDAKKA